MIPGIVIWVYSAGVMPENTRKLELLLRKAQRDFPRQLKA